MSEDRSRVLVDDGVGIHCRDVGEGGAPLIVPGALTSDELAPLADNRRVVYYDTRGRGHSDAVDTPRLQGFYREVDDLDQVRDHHRIERTALLGWSYNAAVVAYYALTAPVRVSRLVLVSPIAPRAHADVVPGPEPGPADLAHLDQLQAEGLPKRDPEAWCRAWRRVYVPLLMGDAAAFDLIRHDPCRCSNEWPDRVTRSLAHVFLDLGIYDWRTDLAGLPVPTLVVHGDADQIPVHTAADWVDALPDATLVTLPGVGHYPWVEAPGLFFEVVDRFLG